MRVRVFVCSRARALGYSEHPVEHRKGVHCEYFSFFYVVTCVERRSVSPLILFDNLRVSHLAGNLLRLWAGGRSVG